MNLLALTHSLAFPSAGEGPAPTEKRDKPKPPNSSELFVSRFPKKDIMAGGIGHATSFVIRTDDVLKD